MSEVCVGVISAVLAPEVTELGSLQSLVVRGLLLSIGRLGGGLAAGISATHILLRRASFLLAFVET